MEAVFVALLPAERRGGHRRLEVSPRPPDGDGTPAIRAEGLTHRFGDFTAVERVNLSIHQGEIFGFLGSNGSGKTTTMRMLTGLLPVTEGEAWVFGQPVEAEDTALRRRLGFMSQSFSLYGELTVRQNLDLHARLYHLPPGRISRRIAELIERFDLAQHLDARAEELPLGVRQRLSLAVAVIHEPELLILDEPTSGVDPIARDRFWEQLLALSRGQGVTIFVSTHFMNEAERCDRISLMHAGRVLAQGTPAALKAEQGAATLEDAFIAYMEQGAAQAGEEPTAESQVGQTRAPPRPLRKAGRLRRFSPRRLWAYARREGTELKRDPIRLAFALLGPMLLMIAMGYGISFDVNAISYAVLDRDRTPASREYLERFAGSPWFSEQAPLLDDADRQRRLASGRLTLAVEIPPGFGRSLKRGVQPEVGFLIDGAIPFRGDTIRGYVEGVHRQYLEGRGAERSFERSGGRDALPLQPGLQERLCHGAGNPDAAADHDPCHHDRGGGGAGEGAGSITNLYATPTNGGEFLLGKQLPYVGLALLSYLTLLPDGALPVPGAAHRRARRTHPRGGALRLRQHRAWTPHVHLHAHPDRRDLRHGHRQHHPHHPLFRHAGAGLGADRAGAHHGLRLSERLVQPRERGEFHQGPDP